jgi:hypothetical protein
MKFSNEYADIQRKFHISRPDYGTSGLIYSDQILSLSKRLNTKDILDYGCGKATLQKSLPFPIQNYDPFIDEFKARPHPSDIVVCTDVMEHIEIFALEDVLQDIRDLTKQIAFFQIATCPAKKFLPDGRNAHLIQENINWWLKQIMPFFLISAVQDINSGFICVCMPNPDWSPTC